MPDRPMVLADDPLWSGAWDYELERRMIEAAGATFAVPVNDTDNERLIGRADVVLRGSRRIDAGVIARCRNCVGVVTYSVGLDGVDLTAAREAAITVRNVPGYCTDEVSDHAILLLLAAVRRLPHWIDSVASGRWLRPEDQLTLRRLSSLTLGVIGAGRIGRTVARKAKAFVMTVIACDPFVTDPDPDLPVVGLDELLARADVVVLCASATTGPSPMILDRRALSALERPDPVIINVARGSMIDEEALGAGLRSGKIAAAALDVRAQEPPDPKTDPLAGAPNLIVTPHVAAASHQAVDDLRRGVAHAAIELLAAAGRLGRS